MISESRGISSPPSPPSDRGVLSQARCVYLESTEQATISVSIALNSAILSLKAMISVGHTNVLIRNRKTVDNISSGTKFKGLGGGWVDLRFKLLYIVIGQVSIR